MDGRIVQHECLIGVRSALNPAGRALQEVDAALRSADWQMARVALGESASALAITAKRISGLGSVRAGYIWARRRSALLEGGGRIMVGPTRGGKGAIARVLIALLGRKNVAGPTLNSLGGEFGLAPLIGKPLAIICDARFAGKDQSVVVERLLRISGEDALTVNRKYREQWTGKLPSRLHVLSNELPKLGDASTAIVGRIVLLLLSHSWLGREDHELEPAFRAQLSGILNWALDGLHRLTLSNNFTRIASADEAIVAMRDLASPVAAFVRDRCAIGPDQEVGVDALYAAYRSWAEDNGHIKSAKHTFGRDLRAAVPSIKVERPRDGDARTRKYVGIGLAVT